MRRQLTIALALLAVLDAGAAVAGSPGSRQSSPAARRHAPSSVERSASGRRRARSSVARSASARRHAPSGGGHFFTAARIGRLSAGQLAGQRVIYSYRGLVPPASLLAQIRHGRAAGVIFFGDNIASRAQIRHVTARLQRAARHSPVRQALLMMVDQEGGQVRRLPGAPMLSEQQIGRVATPARAAARAGRGAGLGLRRVGLNVNLAPVLAVSRSASGFIGRHGRSYGGSPAEVARLGTAFIRAEQRTGVAATAKHFPGLGAATAGQDTDARPVTLRLSRATLGSVDERPYRSAIRARVKLVMVSWATYPALDAHHPAGLSSRIVEHELRGRLGFDGVTITDALQAGALRAYGATGKRAVLAARAGMDLLLCAGQRVAQGTAALHALAKALRARRLARARFISSVQRVIALRGSVRR